MIDELRDVELEVVLADIAAGSGNKVNRVGGFEGGRIV